jgi:formylglycine-generating enzyme required for sulfatase activity
LLRAVDEIVQRLADKEVVVVAGAGVSMGTTGNHPHASWMGLLADGLRHCTELGSPMLTIDELEHCLALADSGEVDLMLAAASVIESRLQAPNGPEWRRWLNDTVGRLTEQRVSDELLYALRSLGTPIMTTNYDGLLESEIGGDRLEAVTWRRPDKVVDVLTGRRRGIVHLHGYWDECTSVVLGVRSYEAVINSAAAQEIQRAIGRFNTLLFVGYGAGVNDPNFEPLLRWLATGGPPNHRHYILLRSGETKRNIDGSGLRVLEYGPTHEFLPKFLRRLVNAAPDDTSVTRRDVASLLAPGESFAESEHPRTPRMAVVAPGSYTMGSSEPAEIARAEELPRRDVTLSYSFAVSQCPVTFDEWDVFASHIGARRFPIRDCGWGRGRLPVINVSWDEAQEYVQWLNELPNVEGTYRLLTEAEWEYAARAGTTTRYWWGDDITPERANYDDSGEHRTTGVDAYPANPFGLYDMLGNVWEWTQDSFRPGYDGAPCDGRAWEDDASTIRVLRGGCWYYDAPYLTVSSRLGIGRSVRMNGVGFRVARTIRQPLKDGGLYQLLSVYSGCVATRRDDGAVVQERLRAGRPLGQVWKIAHVADGTFTIGDPATGDVLGVAAPVGQNLSRAEMQPPVGAAHQVWKGVPQGDGYVFVNSASEKALDAEGISRRDGARIIQFARHGNANQRWWARQVSLRGLSK